MSPHSTQGLPTLGPQPLQPSLTQDSFDYIRREGLGGVWLKLGSGPGRTLQKSLLNSFKEQTEFAKMTREGRPMCKWRETWSRPLLRSPPAPHEPPPRPTPGPRNRSSAVTHTGFCTMERPAFALLLLLVNFLGPDDKIQGGSSLLFSQV